MRYSGTLLMVDVEDRNGFTFSGDIFEHCKKLETIEVYGGSIERVYMEGSHIMAEVLLGEEIKEDDLYFNLCIHTEMTKDKEFTTYRKVTLERQWLSVDHSDKEAKPLTLLKTKEEEEDHTPTEATLYLDCVSVVNINAYNFGEDRLEVTLEAVNLPELMSYLCNHIVPEAFMSHIDDDALFAEYQRRTNND